MKYFILYFFIAFINLCNAQDGSIMYSYALNSGNNNIMQGDHMLYFNRLASTYYMSSSANNKSSKKDLEENEERGEIVRVEIVDTLGFIYHKDLNKKTLFCNESSVDYSSLKSKRYLYDDKNALHLPWSLKDEYKTISGYKCQKATVDFRGRTYDAWFTTEIPLPFGPWKLGGLPGLILEVYDLSKEVFFVAEKITIPDSTSKGKVNKPKNGTEITRKEFVMLLESKEDRIRKAILARLPKGAKFMKGNTKRNVLELENE